jgi:hypothetical protein
LTKVLPDLYSDPALDHPGDETRYAFATEGHPADDARAFFEVLRKPAPEGEPLTGPWREDQKVLREMAAAVRKRKRFRSEPDSLTYPKLRRLLSRFEIRGGQKAEDLAEEIRRWLLPLVDIREHAVAKREQLCTMILSKAAHGEVEIVPEDLLREAGLRGVSLKKLARLTLDPAREEGRDKVLSVFLVSQGNAAGDLQQAADLLWQQAGGRDAAKSLDRVADHWREIQGNAGRPWLAVCVDGIERLSEARTLIDAFDWERRGIRLALSVPQEVGTTLERERPDQVHLRILRDFTESELRQYLRHYNRRSEDLPPMCARL